VGLSGFFSYNYYCFCNENPSARRCCWTSVVEVVAVLTPTATVTIAVPLPPFSIARFLMLIRALPVNQGLLRCRPSAVDGEAEDNDGRGRG